MGITPIKTKFEMVDELLNYIKSRKPDADIYQGQVLRDLLIEAPVEFFYGNSAFIEFISKLLNFSELYDVLSDSSYRASLAQTIGMTQGALDQLVVSYLEGIASNYGMIRKNGTSSNGAIKFYRFDNSNFGTNGFHIPIGTVVQSSTGIPIAYQTTEDRYLVDADLDPVTGEYTTTIPAISNSLGAFTNVSSNVLSVIGPGQAVLPSDILCTNPEPFMGGSDAETSLELLSRLQIALSGNFSGTFNGIVSRVKAFDYVRDAYAIVDLIDPLFIGSSLSDITVWTSAPDQTSITEYGTYLGRGIYTLTNTPADSITYLKLGNGDTLPSICYTFLKDDTSITRYSSTAQDAVVFADIPGTLCVSTYVTSPSIGYTLQVRTSAGSSNYITLPGWSDGNPVENIKVYAGANDLTPWCTYTSNPTVIYYTGSLALWSPSIVIRIMPEVGETIQVNYVYNKYINILDTHFNNPDVKFLGQDISIRSGKRIDFNLTATVQIAPGASQQTIENNINLVLASFINDYKFNRELNAVDVVALLKGVPGVVDVKFPFELMSTGTSGAGDLISAKNEYFQTNDITIKFTTSRIIN